jgi:hypothetical protein
LASAQILEGRSNNPWPPAKKKKKKMAAQKKIFFERLSV